MLRLMTALAGCAFAVGLSIAATGCVELSDALDELLAQVSERGTDADADPADDAADPAGAAADSAGAEAGAGASGDAQRADDEGADAQADPADDLDQPDQNLLDEPNSGDLLSPVGFAGAVVIGGNAERILYATLELRGVPSGGGAAGGAHDDPHGDADPHKDGGASDIEGGGAVFIETRTTVFAVDTATLERTVLLDGLTVSPFEIASDGARIAWADPNQDAVRVIDVATGAEARHFEGQVAAPGMSVASLDAARVWASSDAFGAGELLVSNLLSGAEGSYGEGGVFSAGLRTVSSSEFAVAFSDGEDVVVVDTGTGQRQTFEAPGTPAPGVFLATERVFWVDIQQADGVSVLRAFGLLNGEFSSFSQAPLESMAMTLAGATDDLMLLVTTTLEDTPDGPAARIRYELLTLGLESTLLYEDTFGPGENPPGLGSQPRIAGNSVVWIDPRTGALVIHDIVTGAQQMLEI